MQKKITKLVSTSLMAAAMLTSATVGFIAPMTASAGQMLGETSFDTKGLPWHTCETNPAKQSFSIENGTYNTTILHTGGLAAGGEDRWDLQFRHRNLKMKSGHSYTIKWEVTASNAGEMNVHIADLNGENPVWHNGALGGQGWNNTIVQKGKNSYEFTFTANSSLEVAEWAFHYGGPGKYQQYDCFPVGTELKFDNMSLVCNTCGDGYTEGSCNWNPDQGMGIIAPKNDVRLNQVGYFENTNKKASYVVSKDDSAPKSFKILNASGSEVYTGTSTYFGFDEDSGDYIHILDFSDFTTGGADYTIVVDDSKNTADDRNVSHPFNIANTLYDGMLKNALNYYYQNRSGIDIESKYITSGDTSSLSHTKGHSPDNAYVQSGWVKSYKGSVQEGNFDGDTAYTIDGTGGWYDAGDHGKYVVNGGVSVWTLQNIYERSVANGDATKWADGSLAVPENTNGTPDILDETRYELDWFFKMIVKSSDPYYGDKAGLVYHKLHDQKWTGLACRPADYAETWKTCRIVKPPSLAATFNLAATAAQAARLWKGIDDDYAALCLENAKLTYEAGVKHWYEYSEAKDKDQKNTLYAPLDQAIGGGPYGDTDVKDDMYWAACELYATTGDAKYYEKLSSYSKAFEVVSSLDGGENSSSFSSFNWGNTSSLGSISLYLSDKTSDADKTKIGSSIAKTADVFMDQQTKQGNGIPYKGTSFTDDTNIPVDENGNSVVITGYEWGSNSFVVNNAIVMGYAYDVTGDAKYVSGMTESMDYIFGRNAMGFSYVTGYGDYHCQNPHHRLWSYEMDKSFPMAPAGVMSGGPGSGMQDPYIGGLGYKRGTLAPQKCYVDSIEAWSVNEVTINWNAPFAWVVSFLEDEAPNVGEPTPTNPTNPTDPTDPVDVLWGDANCDGSVTVADVVAAAAVASDPGSFSLTAQGTANADVHNNGDGVSALDASVIQEISLGLYTNDQLPVS